MIAARACPCAPREGDRHGLDLVDRCVGRVELARQIIEGDFAIDRRKEIAHASGQLTDRGRGAGSPRRGRSSGFPRVGWETLAGCWICWSSLAETSGTFEAQLVSKARATLPTRRAKIFIRQLSAPARRQQTAGSPRGRRGGRWSISLPA